MVMPLIPVVSEVFVHADAFFVQTKDLSVSTDSAVLTTVANKTQTISAE